MAKKPLNPDDPIVVKVYEEARHYKRPDRRQILLAKIEKQFGDRCVLSYFTSFNQPVIIEDSDADIIEGVLQKSDLSNGLSMVINSPGGGGLASERIINVCRSYSNNNFEVIVPKMAKSA